MPTLRDCRFDALRALLHTGTTSDMMEQWLIAEGGVRGDQYGSLFCSMLGNKGVPKSSFYDMWHTYLGILGYSGTIRDREYSFWCAMAQNPLPLPLLLTDGGEMLTDNGEVLTDG